MPAGVYQHSPPSEATREKMRLAQRQRSANGKPYFSKETLAKLRKPRVSKVVVSCEFCGTKFEVYQHRIDAGRGKFCSLSCASSSKTGTSGRNWRGGKRTEREAAMSRLEYKNWRVSVFQRDDFACQVCGDKGVDLHAHHIKGWSEFPALRYSVENGLTLCKPCHKDMHKKAKK